MTNINAMRDAGVQAPTALLIFASIIQIALIYTLVLSYLGYLLAEKTGLLKILHSSEKRACHHSGRLRLRLGDDQRLLHLAPE
jgi:hypothetical protein